MDAGSAFILILVLMIAGLFALGMWQTAVAKRQYETVVALSPARAQQIIDSTFSKIFWVDVQGPGDINKRRRTPNGSGATISIDIGQTADGKTHVQAWMSAWKTRYGIVASSGSGLSKKVIRKLEEA